MPAASSGCWCEAHRDGRRLVKLLILSDLHVECAPFQAPAVPFDRVVLAGDIHNGPAALHWARATFPDKPIVQIAGNHEYYDHDQPQCLRDLRAAARALDIDFLENDRLLADGVEFLGCTLWTDYRVFERPGRAHLLKPADAMAANRRLVADYFAIEMPDRDGPRRFEPDDSVRLHRQSLAWLRGALAEPRQGPRVVITHHLPSWRSVVPKFEQSVTNAAFVSDLDELLPQADLWIHGHTHCSTRYRAAGATVACNARGYPGRRDSPHFENPEFDPAMVIDVGSR